MQNLFPLTEYPLLGADLCPEDRSLSVLHTLQSGDQSLNQSESEPVEKSAWYRNLCLSLNLNPRPAMETSHNPTECNFFAAEIFCHYLGKPLE